MNTVSSASITGMVVSLILCVAAPVAMCILLKRKTGAKLSDMFLGVVIFILFARFLEQLLHMAMLSAFGEKLTGNLWLSALYGGAAAAVFEEFGRLIAMKYLLDNQLEKENALMYGVGHGGIEALTIGALTCVSNLATVSMINGGKLESALAGLDEAARATTMATVSQLWTLPSYLFYMVGVERLIAFALQICLSYLVYRAVRYHRRGFFLAAMGIHFAVDYLTSATRKVVGKADSFAIDAKGKDVIIVGGGDTGNDCVGTAIRQGCASVTQLEMMACPPEERLPNNPWPQWPRVKKTDYGQQEAIACFGSDPRLYQTTVKEFLKNEAGQVCAAVISRLESRVVDGRRAMVPTGEEFTLECDLVLIAAGFTGCEKYVAEAFGVDLTPRGTVADTKYATSQLKVFACGDMRRGQSLVVWALREGRDTAAVVDESLMGYTNL